MTSIIGGVFLALVVDALGTARLPVAASVITGTLMTMLGAAVFAWHQACRWRIAEESVPSLFPSTASPGARL